MRLATFFLLFLATPALGAEPTPLAKLAAEMKPGTWAELKTTGLDNSILRAPMPSKGLDIMGWTDDGAWDSRTRQFLYMGLRQRRRFIAYSEATNSWRNIPLPEDHASANSPPNESRFGHIYSRNAFDPATGCYYHMDHNEGGGIYRYDLATEKWTKLPPGGRYLMTGVIEFFSAKNGLVNMGFGKDGIRFFSEERQAWENLGPCPIHGHHSLGRHNPIREEILFAGGNNTPRAVARLKKDGTIEQLKDLPEKFTIRFGKITVDPASGKYLLLNAATKHFYELDSDKNECRLIDDFTKTPWPFGHYEMPVVASVPEHGVTMWVGKKVMLYKPDVGKR